jgi:hypothetical protein
VYPGAKKESTVLKGPTPKREFSKYTQLKESIQKLEFDINDKIKAHNKQ